MSSLMWWCRVRSRRMGGREPPRKRSRDHWLHDVQGWEEEGDGPSHSAPSGEQRPDCSWGGYGNLTLVSKVMAPSARQHHFFIALLRSFLSHSLPVVKCLYLGQWYSDRREPRVPDIKENSARTLLQHVYFCMEKSACCILKTFAAMSTVETHFLFSIALLLSDLTALPSQTRSLCVSETLLLHLCEP